MTNYTRGQASDLILALVREWLRELKLPASSIEGMLDFGNMPPGTVTQPPTPTGGGGTPPPQVLVAQPSGPASGDLAGVYPGPRVVGLQTYSVATDVPFEGAALMYLGGKWRPAVLPASSTPQSGLYYSLATDAKVLNLWSGTANAAAPANWFGTTFNDSAWAAGVTFEATTSPGIPVPGSEAIWSHLPPSVQGEDTLVRSRVTLPAGVPTVGTLSVKCDDQMVSVYVNGVAVDTITNDPHTLTEYDVRTLLIPGASNLIAIRGHDSSNFYAFVSWSLGIAYLGTVGGGSTGPVPPPFVYIVDSDGVYLVDSDGAYLYELL